MSKCSLNIDTQDKLIEPFTKAILNFNSPEGMGDTLGRFLKKTFDPNLDKLELEEEFRQALQDWVEFTDPPEIWPERTVINFNRLKEPGVIDTIVTAAVNYTRPTAVNNEESNMELKDAEYFLVANLVEFALLNNLYGNAQEARTAMLKYFRAKVISSIFVDFDSGKVVRNENDVNLNITKFLLELVDNIMQYAKLKGILSDILMYINGKYTAESFNKVFTIALDLFKDFNSTKLNNLFASKNLLTEGIALQAYNSWVILNNFDMLLKNLLGKTIQIDQKYKDSQYDADKLKYRLVSESNLIKTWRTSEDVSALDELDSVTKILMDSTPKYHFDSSLSIDNQEDSSFGNLTTKDVMYAFTQLQDHPKLREMFATIRYNPMIEIPKLIKSALESSFRQDELNIKDILYSVYKRFFEMKSKTSGPYSLSEIMIAEQNLTNYVITDNLLSYVTGMIDKTVANNHLEYAMDANSGRVLPRFSRVSSMDNFKYVTLRSVTNLNNLLDVSSRNDILGRYVLSAYDTNKRTKNPSELEIEFNYNGKKYKFLFNNAHKDLKLIDFKEYNNGIWMSMDKILDKVNAKNALIKFLDDTLFMGLFNRPELVEQMISSSTNPKNEVESLARIALLSARIIVKHNIDSLLESENKPTTKQIAEYYGIQYNYDTVKPWLDKRSGKVSSILNESETNEILKIIAQAQMVISGEVTKKTIRNLEGNQVAAEGLTNLMNNIRTVWIDSNLLSDSATQHTIFAKQPGLLTRITSKSAAQTSDRLLVKPDKLFNVSESGYSAITLDFLTGFAKKKDKKGNFTIDSTADLMFLPTVYSDKTTNLLLNIDKNAEFEVNGQHKKLIDMSIDEIQTLHFTTMSEMYSQMRQNIEKDYLLFYRAVMNGETVIDPKLFSFVLTQKENGPLLTLFNENGRLLDYEYFKNVFFPTFNEYVNANKETFGKTPVQIFDEVVKPNSRVVVNIHYDGKNNLETNLVIDYYFTMYNGSDLTLYKQLIAKNQARFAKDCLDNFKMYWTDNAGKVDDILLGSAIRLGFTLTLFESQWVDPDTKLLILAKVNGEPILRNNLDEIIPGLPRFELNPILNAFYSYDLMISTLFITSTVGGCYGHKNNFKTSNLQKGTIEAIEEEEAGRLLTLYKRMVIYPATMHNYHLELREGCATLIRVANISDIGAPVYNFLDEWGAIDAHDGSGFCLPWVSDWENGSLPGARAGEDKKTIGTNMDHQYGMSSEFKWALYAFTNERIANSGKKGGINLQNIMKKMADRAWDTGGREFDFTKNYFGEDISLQDFGKDVYFYATDLYTEGLTPGQHYKITGIRNVGLSLYEFTMYNVSESGVALGEAFTVTKEIDSNYKLWEAFGAQWSEEIYTDSLGRSSLVPSKSSTQIVTYYGNNTGYLRTVEDELNGTLIHPEYIYTGTKEDQELRSSGWGLTPFRTRQWLYEHQGIITLRDVYLPMKYSDISYLVNTSAVKNGLTNVNSSLRWYNDEDFDTFTVFTKHFGVQMDADHHADDAELTEMSLVISALESNGYTHEIAKLAYRDLGAIVYAQLKPYVVAIDKYYNLGNSKDLYEVVGKAFLDAFLNSSSNRSDLSDALVANLKNRLGTSLSLTDAGVYIPFSDNSVLSKLISTITSEINKSAIKRKYAGIAAVMIPAYDLIKIYQYYDEEKEKYVDSTYKGLVNKFGVPDKVDDMLEQKTLNGPELTSRQIEFGKCYRVVETGESINLNNTDDYYKYRNEVLLHFKEDFTKGRNLQPAKTTFRQLNNPDEIFDIYDTAAITMRLDFSKWYSKFKKAYDKIAFFDEVYNPKVSLQTNWEKLLEILQDTNYMVDDINRLLAKLDRTTSEENAIFYTKLINEVLKQEVVEAFRDLHKNHHAFMSDGDEINVDPDSIKQTEAEIVLSKIYATKYGLTVGINLNDIDEKFFEDLIRAYFKPNNELYNIALKKSNGQHTYIVLEEDLQRLLQEGVTKLNPRIEIDPLTSKPYRYEDGKKIMPFENCLLYRGIDGTEYIVTNNVEQFLDNKEYETILINAKHNAEKSLKILQDSGDHKLLTRFKNAKNVLEIIDSQEVRENRAIVRAAKRKYTSFQKSLEFTAARIPSLSMQSFMPMKVVGFTDSEENKAYVSHFLAFLQGSDYDIDKVYLLGNEFDDDGMYIGWSPLFDLSSYELLKVSEELPMPTGEEVTIVTSPSDDALDCDAEITELIRLIKYEPENKEGYLRLMIKVLNKINQSNKAYVYCSLKQQLGFSFDETYIDKVLDLINKHQTYFSKVNNDRLVRMTKNSVSSKIRRIINDPLNMVAAYSPIEMDAPKEAAARSQMGAEEREYTVMNPAVKWHMHELNMVGKTAIGITAVGEKVLFALQHYYNEVAKTDKNTDEGKRRQIRALFLRGFPLMKGTNGLKLEVLRNIIANVNLYETDTIWKDYVEKQIADLDNILGITQEEFDLRSEMLLMQLSVMADSALVNSALLSAATDNAKELILSKINANPDMLKIYTYCILLGIDFNSISDFMTSSTVSAINKLSKSNIFVLRLLKRTINVAINEIVRGINIDSYNIGYLPQNVSGADSYNKVITFFKGDGKDNKGFWLKYFNETTFDVNSALSELRYVRNELKHNFTQNNISEYTNLMRYFEDVEDLINVMRGVKHSDLSTFQKLLEYGEELNILGRILGINLGISTNMADKIKYLNEFELLIANRLKSYNNVVSYEVVISDKPYLRDYLTEELFDKIIKNALDLGIIQVTDLFKREYASNFNALRFLQDPEYKLAAIEFYDLIKGTINVLDVVDTVPHYKAMTEAAAIDFTIFDVNSSKFALAYNLANKIKTEYPRLNKKLRTLINYDVQNFLSDVITCKYFEDKEVFLDVKGGYYKPDGKWKVDSDIHTINLATPEGLASFKKWFETIVIPRLKQGKISDSNETVYDSLRVNKFITDLMLTTSDRTLTRDLKYLYTLPMNMSSINSDNEINNFVKYLSEFTALESYTYNNIPLVRLFSYYNLITYKNQYGLDSLTRIFENYMLLPGNEMQDYFDYVGKLDYEKLLSERDYSEDDLLLACAIQISASLANSLTYWGRFVKIYNPETDTLDIYEYDLQKAQKAREEAKGKDYSDEELAQMDAAGIGFGDDDIDASYKVEPKCYKKRTDLNSMKKDLMMNFPFLAFNQVGRNINKSTITVLRLLYNQGKILILNNCG